MSVEQMSQVITSHLNGYAEETIADDAMFAVMGTGKVAVRINFEMGVRLLEIDASGAG